MTNGQLASLLVNKLEYIYGLREARAIQRYLFSFLLSRSTADWLMIQNEKAEDEFEGLVLSLIPELMSRKPVQYVLGKSWFCDMEFYVTPDVLIPRPETEELVLLVAKEFNNSISANILDIGTGSGVIAVSLAKLVRLSQVSALDISAAAIKVAQINAETHNVQIDFTECDVLMYDKTHTQPDPFDGRQFDIIVSNPPYIKESEIVFMHENVVLFEPHKALFVTDQDPLIFYRAIIKFSELHLANNGHLYMEINESEVQNLEVLLKKFGYIDIEISYDLNDKPRFIKASK